MQESGDIITVADLPNNNLLVEVSSINQDSGLETENSSLQDAQHWEYAGKGAIIHEDHAFPEEGFTQKIIASHHHKLGQIPATAISGNDITSSCLYVAGLAALSAGKYAPISLLLVVVVLFLFRGVYSEVGTALPLNGGAYNVLLNTTTKFVAAIAACLTLLSYVATAVVSASSAAAYAHTLWDKIDPLWATILLLGVFCLLSIMGISESSVVATLIFGVHCTVLVILIILCSREAFRTDWKYLAENWNSPPKRGVAQDIFFGFCSGLLGVSGFETSANFIEEQKPGVFPKTLRNMWIAVALFNPIISLLSLALIPDINNLPVSVSEVILAEMGRRAEGEWLQLLVCADAALVLSGAVLTGYVGIIGLMRRMALDRLLPGWLLQQNSCRQTNHWIILLFFGVTSSLYLMVTAKDHDCPQPCPTNSVDTLAGVYTVSFLAVMGLFAIGNLLLKYKRGELPREIKTFWGFAVVAAASVFSALIGNIIYNVSVLVYFSIYFSVTIFVVGIMMFRIKLLRIIFLSASRIPGMNRCMGDFLKRKIKEIQDTEILFFTRRGKLSVLNKAILYIKENEITDKIKIVHCYEKNENIPSKLVKNVKIMDRCYPKTRVDLLLVRGRFSPGMVQYLSEKYDIPKNFMFLTCPNSKFPSNLAEFGGVRLITH